MKNSFGIEKAELKELPKVEDRITFLYLERCKINRKDGAISVLEERGKIFIPAATLSVLLLGPGTEISHRAVELLGSMGVCIVWVGEEGVKYYASGEPLTHTSKLLINQAKLVSNEKKRIAVARQMYQMRFDEDVTKLSMQALRGREGSRVRKAYREAAKKNEIEWTGRMYSSTDHKSYDAVNSALSSGNACLYGISQSVIMALGCSPGLGFVHTGHDKSFVYDIADLYKADLIIPLAFELAKENPDDISSVMRRRCRDVFRETKLLKRMTKDIITILDSENEFEDTDASVLELWDKDGNVKSGVGYRLED